MTRNHPLASYEDNFMKKGARSSRCSSPYTRCVSIRQENSGSASTTSEASRESRPPETKFPSSSVSPTHSSMHKPAKPSQFTQPLLRSSLRAHAGRGSLGISPGQRVTCLSRAPPRARLGAMPHIFSQSIRLCKYQTKKRNKKTYSSDTYLI